LDRLRHTLIFYENNFKEHEVHFCLKFKNKLRTILASNRRTKSQIFI